MEVVNRVTVTIDTITYMVEPYERYPRKFSLTQLNVLGFPTKHYRMATWSDDGLVLDREWKRWP